MEQLINIYNEFYGDIFITIIRILVGILLILSKKYVSKTLKCYVTVVYFGGILGTVIPCYLNCSIKVILLGLTFGMVLGYLYVKFQKKDYMTDGIFLFVYFYEFVGLIFFVLNINFSEIFKIYIYYVDYATIYISIIIAAILSVAMCIVLHKKKIIEEIIAENKYFWIGNYFIISLFIGISNFPVYEQGDGKEMSLVLLNVTDDFQFSCLMILETMMMLLYREYKKTKTEKNKLL